MAQSLSRVNATISMMVGQCLTQQAEKDKHDTVWTTEN